MEEARTTDSVQELEEGKDAGAATEQAPQDETIVTAEAATEVSHDAEEREQVDSPEDPQHDADLDRPSQVETAGPTDAYTDTSQPGAMHPLVRSCQQRGMTDLIHRDLGFNSSCSPSPGALASTPPSRCTTCLRATGRYAVFVSNYGRLCSNELVNVSS